MGFGRHRVRTSQALLNIIFKPCTMPPPTRDFEDILSLIEPKVSAGVNASLIKEVTREEIRLSVFQWGHSKLLDQTLFPASSIRRIGMLWAKKYLGLSRAFFKRGPC